MKNRVAYIATLITLVFGMTVLLISAYNFSGEHNAELSEELSQLTRVSAVAIGTSHGLYPAGMKPELKQDLLSEIKS